MKTKFYFLTLTCIVTVCLHGLSQDGRIWATYYGDTGNDGGFSVATDAAGNVYMAGITMSISGMASGGFQNTFGGGIVDAYLVKFDSSGVRLWATYYGGPGDEMAFFGGKLGITADASGNVYLAGLTNSASGIASGGFQNTINGTVNAFLVKFDAAGNRIWATYYGGGGVEKGYSVAADNFGNVYLAGLTGSATGIAFNGFQNAIGGLSDAFLVKFDAAGNRVWATYYGGAGSDEGYSVATDVVGNIYLAGVTASTSGIASGGSQNTFGGGANDVFLVKFDSSGVRLWATYYGGTGDELALFAGDIGVVAADASGNSYLTGLTTSQNNIASGGFQNSFGGGSNDAFLVKFDPAGVRLWGTYYGGTGSDRGYHVDTDPAGNAYLVGRTESSSGIASGGFQNNYSGNSDAFLAKFAPSGNRLCATYFGSTGVDECNGVAVDVSGNVYLAGNTENTSGIAWLGFQNAHGGGTSDAMLVKFSSQCTGTSTEEVISDQHPVIFPNPSEGSFFITFKNNIKMGVIEIYNALGEKVYSEAIFNESKKEVIIKNTQSGIYFVKVFAYDDLSSSCISQLIVGPVKMK